MGCPICKNLERVYEAMLSEFNDARSSAGYQVSRKLAAQKNVEMERARYELEEHKSRCVSASIVSAYLPRQDVPGGSTQVAA
jgi:hypothetical protein